MYIKNHKVPTIFRLHNIQLKLSTCPIKFKWLVYTEKPLSNADFQNFWCTNIDNRQICEEKDKNKLCKFTPHDTNLKP